MICELYNSIEKLGSTVFGTHPYYKDEISLTKVLSQIVYGIVIIIFFIWWILPLRKIAEIADKKTFKCNKDKVEKGD